MPTPLLTTKTHAPQTRRNLVLRPRLVKLLNTGLHQGRRLTLLCAPAGSGKTTLLTAWLERLDCPHTWLSLDEGDNDPIHFITYLVEALSKIDTQMVERVEELLQTPQPPSLETLAVELVNGFAESAPLCVLVLDDIHAITSPAIFDLLDFVLSNQPDCLHLVLSSRMDPPLSIHRLRAQGLMTEVRTPELRFTHAEMTTFLNELMGLDLPDEDIAMLELCTEGWVAGLQLAALAIRQHEDRHKFISRFTGAHRFITGYLIDEVMARLPAEMNEFLLQTAFLERLCPALCNAVTGSTESARMLHEMEQMGLFLVPLDDVRVWYRYHHLFAEFLQQSLRETNPAVLAVIHDRAGRWFEQNGFPREAVRHAFATGDQERAACLVERYVPQTAVLGQVETVFGWFADLPQETLRAHPQLGLHYALALLLAGRTAEIAPYLESAGMILPEQPLGGDETGQAGVENQMPFLRSLLLYAQGNQASSIALIRDALERVPADSPSGQGDLLVLLGDLLSDGGDVLQAERVYVEALRRIPADDRYDLLSLACRYRLAHVHMLQGSLHKAVDIANDALKTFQTHVATSKPALFVIGLLHRTLGAVLYEWNELDVAEDHLRLAIEFETASGFRPRGQPYDGLLQLISYARDGDDDSRDAPEDITTRRAVADLWFQSQNASCRVRLAILRGDLQQAARWVNADISMDDLAQAKAARIARIRVLVATGSAGRRTADFEEARALLEPLLETAETGSQTHDLIVLTALQALVLQNLGRTTAAHNALLRSLELAAPGGYLRTYVELGEPMARLLQETSDSQNAPHYASTVLAAFAHVPQDFETPPLLSLAAEPLTEREEEILRLISAGLSNPEIARELCLSVNTVKWYTSRIFDKLDVAKRAQAVDRAHELNLL